MNTRRLLRTILFFAVVGLAVGPVWAQGTGGQGREQGQAGQGSQAGQGQTGQAGEQGQTEQGQAGQGSQAGQGQTGQAGEQGQTEQGQAGQGSQAGQGQEQVGEQDQAEQGQAGQQGQEQAGQAEQGREQAARQDQGQESASARPGPSGHEGKPGAWHNKSVGDKPGSGMTPEAMKPTIPPVRSSFGSLRFLVLFQGRMHVPLRATFSGDYFTLRKKGTKQFLDMEPTRIRLIMLGHFLNKNLKYVFQGDANAFGKFLLDFKFIYNIPWVPGLSIMAGRYLPNFTLIMPILITRLEATQYPIYMTEGGYAPWRQLGVEVIYKKKLGPGKFTGIFGVLDGPTNSWGDDNVYKDFLLRVEYGFKEGALKGLWFGVNSWIGFPHCKYDASNLAGSTCSEEDYAKDKADLDVKTGFMLRYDRDFSPLIGLKLLSEVIWRRFVPWAENRDPYDGYSVWAHLAVPLFETFEPLLRGEYFVVNTDDDGSWAWRLTTGMNIYLYHIHSHIKINYIYQKVGETYNASTDPSALSLRQTWADYKYGANPVSDAPTFKRDFHMLIVELATEF